MKFTIAIISYNAENSIERCIESCTTQTYRDLEILVVDDNSSDKTIEIVTKLQAKDGRIKLIQHSENRSALQARKTAIQNASSNYLWLIDSDDCIDDKGAIGLLARHIKANDYPDMVCFGSNDYFESGELKRVFFDWGKEKPLEEWKLDSDFRPYTRITKTAVLRRAAAVIPDDLYLYRHNDLFMFCLVKLCTSNRVYLNKALYKYMLSNNSVTNQKDVNSITKHIELINELLKTYKVVASKIDQTTVDIDTFIESERAKLIKYAIGQYKNDPVTYMHALKKIYNLDQEFVISLTTYSKRIQTVDKVISSLLAQSIAVDKIILWLDENEVTYADLPQGLKQLCSARFEIKFCPNYKSYKKLIPTLSYKPNATIITFDDDIEYPSNLVEKLILAHVEFPDAVITNVARNILVKDGQLQPYPQWNHAFKEQVNVPLLHLLPIGVGGVLYPPNVFHEDVVDSSKFMELAPHGDDIWFKCMTLLRGVRVVCTTAGFGLSKYQLAGTDDIGLWQSVNESSDSNLQQLQNVLHHYDELAESVLYDSFGYSAISPSNVLEIYKTLDKIRKDHKKFSVSKAIDLISNQLGSLHAYDPLQTVAEPISSKNDEATKFKIANSMFLRKDYKKAYDLYEQLHCKNPRFKYYKTNMARCEQLLK